jgi:hypothetical protein
LNEDPDEGGTVPRVDENGRWYPPVYRAGFGAQVPGTVYRWENGIISIAAGYQWYNGYGYTPNNEFLEIYRAMTTFYSNPFDQFLVADGDASTRDMPTAQWPQDRWYPVTFHHQQNLTRVDFAGDQQYLAGNGPDFIQQFGLGSYQNQDHSPPASGGLAGNLAILIALIAFSCRTQDLHTVLIEDRAWRNYRWRGHNRRHGRM